jgi:hypothetical protein
MEDNTESFLSCHYEKYDGYVQTKTAKGKFSFIFTILSVLSWLQTHTISRRGSAIFFHFLLKFSSLSYFISHSC